MSVRERKADFSPSSGLRTAAQLLQDGLTAFLEGNPFRGRRVQDQVRSLLGEVEAWQDQALSAWAPEPGLQDDLALANQIESLARSAQQLAALAESRPSTKIKPEFRSEAESFSAPLRRLLSYLLGDSPEPPAHALEAIRDNKVRFLSWCADVGRANPRLFSTTLMTIAAAQRIEEATEVADAAARIQIAAVVP